MLCLFVTFLYCHRKGQQRKHVFFFKKKGEYFLLIVRLLKDLRGLKLTELIFFLSKK